MCVVLLFFVNSTAKRKYWTMLLEIQIAVSFLTSYLYNKLPRRRVDLFSVELTKQLREKFEGHWYPERPMKGSGFRCLSIGDELDPVIMNASQDSGLSLEEIRSSLPDKLTMWVDPDEVSYRIGKTLVLLFDTLFIRSWVLIKYYYFIILVFSLGLIKYRVEVVLYVYFVLCSFNNFTLHSIYLIYLTFLLCYDLCFSLL